MTEGPSNQAQWESPFALLAPGERIRVKYKNWRGETAIRNIELNSSVHWRRTKWHPEPQWLIVGRDIDSGENRFWAVKGMEPVELSNGAEMDSNSSVDHPAHYGGKDDPYEAIKVIEAWKLNFRLGNCVKYVRRAGQKPDTPTIQDLKKARWYLDREIAALEESGPQQHAEAVFDKPPTIDAEIDALRLTVARLREIVQMLTPLPDRVGTKVELPDG